MPGRVGHLGCREGPFGGGGDCHGLTVAPAHQMRKAESGFTRRTHGWGYGMRGVTTGRHGSFPTPRAVPRSADRSTGEAAVGPQGPGCLLQPECGLDAIGLACRRIELKRESRTPGVLNPTQGDTAQIRFRHIIASRGSARDHTAVPCGRQIPVRHRPRRVASQGSPGPSVAGCQRSLSSEVRMGSPSGPVRPTVSPEFARCPEWAPRRAGRFHGG